MLSFPCRATLAAALLGLAFVPCQAATTSPTLLPQASTTSATSTTSISSPSSTSNPSTNNADGRPNIVMILTDDQDKHLGSLDHMPNVQALLIDQGLTFNNHFSHVSLCCPSRATLWTGKHAHTTNVTAVRNDVAGGAWQQVQAMGWYKNNIAPWLQEEGYNTYYSGKIYNGLGEKNYCKPHCMQGWTMGDFLVGPGMYRYYNSTFLHVDNDTWSKPKRILGYSTDHITDYMKGYIDDAVSANKPFLAIAGPVAPHVSGGLSYRAAGVANNRTQFPYPMPKFEYMNLFPDVAIPRTANFNPANRTGVAGVWGLEQLTDANVNMLENYYRLRTQTLLSVDDMVDEIVAHLDSKGILNNTYIIYTSDNGFHLGNHRLQAGKEQCFEEDVNIPFIIRGPGIGKGISTDLVTGHIDVAPTILNIAGASLDHELDGTPITFPLETKADFDRNYAVRGEFAHLEYWGPFHQEGMESNIGVNFKVNLQTYKALRLLGDGYNLMYSVWCQDKAHELYDMSWDPYQMTNLHPDAPLNPYGFNAYLQGMDTVLGRPTEQVINRLDALVLVEKSCVGDVCRHPWKELHPNANVTNLRDALHPQYDAFYENSYKVAKVGWLQCYTGYSHKSSATLYDLANESPLWIETHIVEAVRRGDAAGSLLRKGTTWWLAVWVAALFLLNR